MTEKTIVRLLRDAHAAAPAFPFPFSAAHALNVARLHLGDPDHFALLYGDYAVLLASCQPHPFAPVRYATETMWWIDPAHRGGSAAARMLREYEAWARDKGCLFIGMAALASFPGVGRMYERSGYTATETHYMKVLG